MGWATSSGGKAEEVREEELIEERDDDSSRKLRRIRFGDEEGGLERWRKTILSSIWTISTEVTSAVSSWEEEEEVPIRVEEAKVEGSEMEVRCSCRVIWQ